MPNPADILVDDGRLFSAETATASTSSSLSENEEEIGVINRLLTLADAALSGAERALRVSPNHSDRGFAKPVRWRLNVRWQPPQSVAISAKSKEAIP
jgi:hypothetical protein